MQFQSTPSARRATCKAECGAWQTPYFNPRPPRGGRPSRQSSCCWCSSYFNPRPPRGGRPIFKKKTTAKTYFNPRPPRGGRRDGTVPAGRCRTISIHALREEGDGTFHFHVTLSGQFQSTPSARRATPVELAPRCLPFYFNPRPPRGGRRGKFCRACKSYGISIHALREEGDRSFLLCLAVHTHFNPRPPRGGRRSPPPNHRPRPCISIHALREEGDKAVHSRRSRPQKFQSTPSARRATILCFPALAVQIYFNPRPPRGGRLDKALGHRPQSQFQSTPSARRATPTAC